MNLVANRCWQARVGGGVVFRFRGDGPLEAKDRVDATDAREEGGSVHDQGRIGYMRTHIKVMGDTVELDGVGLVGYAPWGAGSTAFLCARLFLFR